MQNFPFIGTKCATSHATTDAIRLRLLWVVNALCRMYIWRFILCTAHITLSNRLANAKSNRFQISCALESEEHTQREPHGNRAKSFRWKLFYAVFLKLAWKCLFDCIRNWKLHKVFAIILDDLREENPEASIFCAEIDSSKVKWFTLCVCGGKMPTQTFPSQLSCSIFPNKLKSSL